MDDPILIVDEEEMICSLLARRLAEEGYCWLSADNGREGLARFHKGDLSLIISDLIMPEPEMDGMELLKSVTVLNSNMMVIIMTGLSQAPG